MRRHLLYTGAVILLVSPYLATIVKGGGLVGIIGACSILASCFPDAE